jgi:predicted kinase
MLIVLAGLPGAGKSSIAQELASEIGAVWLRIDSIEQGIRESGVVAGSLEDAGYRAAYRVAEENLRIGLPVIADSVNPWMLTRNAWRDAGFRAGASVFEFEIICSNEHEHRRRLDTRAGDVRSLKLPNWQAVISRDYHPWDRDRIVMDTAGQSIAECVVLIRAYLGFR